MKRIFVFIFLTVFIFAGIANASENVVRIGVIFPMTGMASAFGQMTKEGLDLANSLEPKVLGKKIDLILLDDKSDKIEAANAASRLIGKEKVSVILGPIISPNALSVGPICERYKVPFVTPSATNPLVTQGKKFAFRVCFVDDFQGFVMAKFAVSNLKARKAAVLFDKANDYSVALAKFFMDSFKKLTDDPKSIVYIGQYKSGDQDFTAQIVGIQNAKADVIFIPGFYSEIALFAKQAREQGIKAPFLAGDAAQAPELLQIGKEAVEGLYFSTHFDPKAATTENGKKFIEEYKAKYNKDPNALAALGYDAYGVVWQAINRAGSTDPVKIRDEIAKTKGYEGATGIINIDEHGNAIKSAVVLKVENGTWKYVTTVNP